MQQIPLLDLSAYYQAAGTTNDLKQLLCQVDQALCEIGFLCVKGTPLTEEFVKRTQTAALEFFDLPLQEKNEVKAVKFANRGYTGLAELGLSYAMDASDLKQDRRAPADLFERYRIGPVAEFSASLREQYGQTAYAPNIWPARPSDFAALMQSYYEQANQLAQDLLGVFALALGLERDWFKSKVDHSMASLALNHYPAQTEPALPGQLRAGPHTDYGTLTIVAPTAAPGGLQIRTKNGQWQDVSVEPGTFVVNIGDMMAQWTNDRWVSTVHRVANPTPGQALSSRRLSLVFFHQPNPDALIDCIPTCVDANQGNKYQPVNAGDYISAKINRHFKNTLVS
jgi:isopenicillin N synthase-like dioxygenase